MNKRLLFSLVLSFGWLFLFAQKDNPLDMKVSVGFEGQSLNGCIRKLENVTGLSFSFSAADLAFESKTALSSVFTNKPLSQVLDAILKNTGLDYKYLGGQVVIFKKKELFTISGFIKDLHSGEVLIGASVFLKNPMIGTTTNAYGFYSLSLPGSRYDLFASFIGVEKGSPGILLRADTTINIELPSDIELAEVEVKLPDQKEGVGAVTKVDRINIETLRKIPAPLGEPDVLRVIQMQPGVHNLSEASLGYHVRGGSFGHNLVLLDDAPVYNPTHLLGNVSAFNTDMIKSIDFYKEGIPAIYQAGASSVLDVRTRDGNDRSFHAGGGVGLVSSRLYVEGPLKKEKSSFFLAGRKSVLPDLILKSGFYDLNLKASYTINDRNRLYVSAYTGNDRFDYGINTVKWNNKTFTLRYNHVYNGKLFSNTSLIYSRFRVGNAIKIPEEQINVDTDQFVESRIAKFVLSFFPRPGHHIHGGLHVNDQVYSSFNMTLRVPGADTSVQLSLPRRALELAAFIEAEHQLSRSLSFNMGLRAPFFRDNSSGEMHLYDMNTRTQDTILVRPTTFIALEPRLSLRWMLRRDQSLRLSYNHINQFQQQFQGGYLLNPVQVWLPSSSALKPQTVDQLALGYSLKNRSVLYCLGTFYKRISRVSDFIDGAQLISSNNSLTGLVDVELMLKEGTGTSYGLELSASKTEGRLNGWLSYTWARTLYDIPGINNGKPYYASFDNRHTISAGLVYELGKKWEFSSLFNYRSGRAFSFPDAYYELGGTYHGVITERNKERTLHYHRLDISFIYKPRPKDSRFFSTWNFSLMNIYNKFNPVYYTITGKEVQGISLFPLFPSATYNFRF